MVKRINNIGGCFCKPLLFFLLLGWGNSVMQAGDFTAYRDKIFSKKVHLHLNTPLSFSPRARTSFSHPDFKVDYFPSVNFKFGLTLLFNLNTRYSLSAGLDLIGLSFYSMKRDFLVPAKYTQLYVSDDPMNYRGDYSYGRGIRFEPYPFFWSLPLNFIHRIPVSNRIDLRYGLGIDLKIYAYFDSKSTSQFIDVNNPDTPIAFYCYYVYSPDRALSLRPDALFSFGLNRYLKNNKMINANFFVHVPMYKPMQGVFGFLLDTPYEAWGTFKKSELAFGFEFNYIFTFVKREKRLSKKQPVIE